MNDERVISLLAALTANTNRIANALEAIALTNAPAPNFIKPIESYADFDFTTIGALVKARDAHGPTELEWGGYTWTRRSPQNKFGEAIWFSRPTGKDAEGNVKYVRLITFKALTPAEPLPRKVEALVEKPQPAPAAETPIVKSELDAHFGTPRITAAADIMTQAVPPTSEIEFIGWLKHQNINGKEIHSALGTDAKGWLRLNPGKGWGDVAQAIAATLGK